MMPPANLVRRDDSLKNLESRIDLLIDLRNRKKIDDQKFQAILPGIIQDVQVFSVADVVLRNYYRDLPPRIRREDADIVGTIRQNLQDIEDHYHDYQQRRKRGELTGPAEYYQDIDRKYAQTRQQLIDLQRILPAFSELIADLEQ